MVLNYLQNLEKVEFDPYYGKRVHAWVGILQKTDDTESHERTILFIEPSTGFSFPADDPSYLGIESVWDRYNYYVSYFF